MITDKTTVDSFTEEFLVWVTKTTINRYNEVENINDLEINLDWYSEFINDDLKNKLSSSKDTTNWTKEQLEDAYHYAIDLFVIQTLKTYFKLNTVNELAEAITLLVVDVIKEIDGSNFNVHTEGIYYKEKLEGLKIRLTK